MEIRIGERGKIVAGDGKGQYVKVVDDTQKTGGFLILTSPYPDFRTGFDSWVENEVALQSFFDESNWKVLWSL